MAVATDTRRTVSDDILRILNRRTRRGATDLELAAATERSYESVSRARRRLAGAGIVIRKGVRNDVTVWGVNDN
jgi:predicted transcriptional regulator